jgi:hypothetical protein
MQALSRYLGLGLLLFLYLAPLMILLPVSLLRKEDQRGAQTTNITGGLLRVQMPLKQLEPVAPDPRQKLR